MDHVVVNFWPDERISPEVITDVGPEVACEVIAAHVIGTTGETVTRELGIEPQILAPDASHYIAAEFLAKFAAVHGIEIIKNWPIGSLSEEGGTALGIFRLTCPPCNLAAEAEVVLQNKVPAEAGIQPSADRREGIAVVVRRYPRPVDRSKAERSVKFLGLRAEREQECCCENTNC